MIGVEHLDHQVLHDVPEAETALHQRPGGLVHRRNFLGAERDFELRRRRYRRERAIVWRSVGRQQDRFGGLFNFAVEVLFMKADEKPVRGNY